MKLSLIKQGKGTGKDIYSDGSVEIKLPQTLTRNVKGIVSYFNLTPSSAYKEIKRDKVHTGVNRRVYSTIYNSKLPLTQSKIVELTGLKPQQVNAALHQLSNECIIRTDIGWKAFGEVPERWKGV